VATSHLKALLIHHEVIVPITAGKLHLGTAREFFLPNSTASGTNG
jgi:thiamine phosphate synthase YjbQ (UPF0047 family)